MPLKEGRSQCLCSRSAVRPEVQQARKPIGHRLTHSTGLEFATGERATFEKRQPEKSSRAHMISGISQIAAGRES
jgi:hypothetical protein